MNAEPEKFDHLSELLRGLDSQRQHLDHVIRIHTKRGDAAEAAVALSDPKDEPWKSALEALRKAHYGVVAAARADARTLDLLSVVPWALMVSLSILNGAATLTVRGAGLRVWLASYSHLVTEYEIDPEPIEGVTTITGARVGQFRVRTRFAVNPALSPPGSLRLDNAVVA